MMISRVLRWFPGWVQVEAEGGYPEKLLNDLTTAGVTVWQVRQDGETLHFCCGAGEYRQIRRLARRAFLRMRVKRKHGLPFWCHRHRHRCGLLVGLVLYVVILGVLSNRIWVIEVEGNATIPNATILEYAQHYGVRLGARMDQLDIKGLQLHGADTLPSVSFITVNPSHSVARIQVTERASTPHVLDLSQPSNMVAVRDGLILRVESRSGVPMVRAGEAVTAGTVLISGCVSTDLGDKLYRSYGEVWAQTNRRITVSVPLLQTTMVVAGKAVCRPTVSFLFWDFPLYSKTPLQGEWRQYTTQHPLIVGDTVLPCGITCDYYFPLTERRRMRTPQQAAAVAEEQLAQQEETLFLPNRFSCLTKKGSVRNGHYVLTASYLCEENIAMEIPLHTNEGIP